MKLVFLIISFLTTFVSANFIVISDIHYDQFYSVGASTKCFLGNTGMGCCRNFSVPLNGSTPAREYGELTCDSPKALLDITFKWLASLQVDYLVFLGDIVDHDLLIQNSTYNLNEINVLGNYFKTLPYPVYALMGNHDGFIVDNLWDDGSGQEWVGYVQNSYGQPTVLGTTGYYTVVHNKIRFIFLNCLGYDTHNLEILKYPKNDLFNQTAWFTSLIENVKKNNETVYLFSHFGSEIGEATDFYNKMISSIDYPYITYFAGHSHHDEIRMMTNSSFFYINPSLVPDNHFPEVRLYLEENNSVIDYVQYGLNLTKAYLEGTVQFEVVYTAKNSYSLEDLSAQSWSNFFSRMESNITLKNIYNSHVNWGV